jgi:hypothetical protein
MHILVREDMIIEQKEKYIAISEVCAIGKDKAGRVNREYQG